MNDKYKHLRERARGGVSQPWWFYPLLVATTLAIAAASAWAGYRWGVQRAPQEAIQQLGASLETQYEELDRVRREARANLDALTARIGLLQAHITRLNALGSKLVAMADLKEGEFDFTSVPPLGGAESQQEQPSYGDAEITQVLEAFELSLMEKEQQLRILEEMLMSRNLQAEIRPEGLPVVDGWISSRYGYRNDPFTGRRQFHKGIDIAGTRGTAIHAAAGGIVIHAERHPQYGNMVEIDHRNGYVTRYAHCAKLLVKAGDVVKRGQVIALMGSTGRSTGNHLHFEVLKDGHLINPMRLLKKKG